MSRPNGSGGSRHRKSDPDDLDAPTVRFPAMQKALDKAFEPMDPVWPTTDPDD